MKPRHYILGICLVATVVASIKASHDEPVEISEATSRVAHQPIVMVAKTQAKSSIDSARHWEIEELPIDLFDTKPVLQEALLNKPAVPIIIAPVVPPEPVAPPLPFSYLGKIVENGKVTVYVAKGDRSYLLKGGETIDGIYTVLSIDAQKVIFNYKPLATQQILMIGAMN